MQATKAKRGGATKERDLVTVNVDCMISTEADCNGTTIDLNCVLVKTLFGKVRSLASKTSASMALAWRRIKNKMESITDPGGKLNFRVQRVHSDPGTEFLGGFEEELAADNIVITKGEVNRHTDNCIVEGRNKRVQILAAAMSITACMNEEIAISLRGESMTWASEMLNHIPTTPAQKEAGITPYEEQSGEIGASKEFTKQYPVFGEMVFLWVRQGKRSSKVWKRGLKCVFTGISDTTPRAIRATPYQRRGEYIDVLRTMEGVRWTAVPGVFPLKGMKSLRMRRLTIKSMKSITSWITMSAGLGSNTDGTGDEINLCASMEEAEVSGGTKEMSWSEWFTPEDFWASDRKGEVC
jgi:hypothetical protein